jgi:PAT family beta-lactamase induction signal transducer AmpG
LALLVWGIFSFGAVRRLAGAGFHQAAKISRVPFDSIFVSFFRKPGILRMIAFLLLYRLGEAMLVKMSPAFLIDPRSHGGMGLSQAQFGTAYGTIGIITMTIGGILGGVVASWNGLKRWLVPMCIAINLPHALYIYLAWAQPPEFWKVLLCVAGETFGYGFGFTAYMLYMLYIAGEGEHKTSHFAICTGFMGLSMMLPGMLSGELADALGWFHFYVLILLATIPGFIMLALIPLDPEFGRREKVPGVES